MSRRILRNMSTAKSRAFWADVERVTRRVLRWPDWRRAGINVVDRRSLPGKEGEHAE